MLKKIRQGVYEAEATPHRVDSKRIEEIITSLPPIEPTEKQIMDFAAALKIRTWDQGDDGFGGEWVISDDNRKSIKDFWAKARSAK